MNYAGNSEKIHPARDEVYGPSGHGSGGRIRKFSDLDLVFGDMKEAFMVSLLPCRVDVPDYHAASPEFQQIVAVDHEVIFRQR